MHYKLLDWKEKIFCSGRKVCFFIVLLIMPKQRRNKKKRKQTMNLREDNVIQLSVWISISKPLSLHHRHTLSLAMTAKHRRACRRVCVYLLYLPVHMTIIQIWLSSICSSPHLLFFYTSPLSVFMSLLFISLISDCFFPLESASSCQHFPRGEWRDLRSSWQRELPF